MMKDIIMQHDEKMKIKHPRDVFEKVELGDKRLDKRLVKLVDDITNSSRASILNASPTRLDAKAAYNLLSNNKLTIEKLSDAILKSAIENMSGTVLLIEDTTDINLKGHTETEDLGYSSARHLGIQVHSVIAVKPCGTPLSLVLQYYHTRPEKKSSISKSIKDSLPIEEKESYRFVKPIEDIATQLPDTVHPVVVADREGDMYELFDRAKKMKMDFVVRAFQNRNTETNEKVLEQIRKTKPKATITVNVPRNPSKNIPSRTAEMEIAYCQIAVAKPRKSKNPELPNSMTLNVIRVSETGVPDNKKIEWILLTSLPINDDESVKQVIEYYTQRWKIERFHYVLKSGCNAEKIQQRTLEKINTILLIYSVIAMFIMSITYIARISPDTPCDEYFDVVTWKTLYITTQKKQPPDKPYSMADAVKYIGELGSYKRNPSDGPPGLKSIWKGLLRLYDFIELDAGRTLKW